jgi:hypothetical protein
MDYVGFVCVMDLNFIRNALEEVSGHTICRVGRTYRHSINRAETATKSPCGGPAMMMAAPVP